MSLNINKSLLLTALLLAGGLSACQDKTDATDTAVVTEDTVADKDATTADKDATTAESTAADDAAATEDAEAEETADADTEKAQQTPEVTEMGEIPAGYEELSELSAEPVREFKAAPERALQSDLDYYALLDTSRGQVLVDLFDDQVPVTVNNFVYLARNHFYDGTRFHRVIDGFMAQAGDPLSADEAQKDAWGTGGPGYQFGDEIRQDLTFSEGDLLAMANSGPSTNGSQFFITFGPTEFLNGRHTIFGKVVKDGVDSDTALANLTRTADTSAGAEAPVEGAVPDKLLSVRILTKARN